MFIQYEIHSEIALWLLIYELNNVKHKNIINKKVKYEKKKEHGKSVENKSRQKSETFTGNNNKIIEFLFSHSVIMSHLCVIWE